MLNRLFLEHPRSVGETYSEHMLTAGGFGVKLIKAGCACLVHAVFPNLCIDTGSRSIKDLHDRMILNRTKRLTETADASAGSAT